MTAVASSSADPLATVPPLSAARQSAIRRTIRKARLKEWCLFDSGLAQRTLALAQYAKAKLQFARGQRLAGWLTLTRLHRAGLSRGIDRRIERRLQNEVTTGQLQATLQQYLDELQPNGRVADIFAKPTHILGPHATVLKSAKGAEKGVLLLNYSYVYAPFAKLFDLSRIAERYFIALEPSWSGSCDENMLLYGFLPTPAFVQTTEPRDVAFLKQCPATLIPVPSAGNWWVDPELYRPLPDAKQDADLVMVAAWADFKRHWAFFAALGKLRQEGRVLKTLLAGYPSGLTMQEIADLASYFGIRDQIELYEWLPPEEVNRLVNRAKVNVLWSRREGFNRAVVEGMFAGLPFVMRKGHNYGDPQAHVNAQTGCYATEEELPRVLVEMVDHPEKYSPREWAMANMTCLHGTKILNESIRGEALRRGEPWTEDLVGHVSVLHGNKYLNPGDAERFRPDYAFLETMLR